MKRNTLSHYAAILIAAVLGAASASAALDIAWYTIDGGGGQFSVGGTFALSGTIGQPDAGAPMTGGSFELNGGFWAGAAAQPGCVADLNGDGVVDLNDLSDLLANFGTNAGATFEDGDTDGDGDVDLTDLSALLVEFGAVCN